MFSTCFIYCYTCSMHALQMLYTCFVYVLQMFFVCFTYFLHMTPARDPKQPLVGLRMLEDVWVCLRMLEDASGCLSILEDT